MKKIFSLILFFCFFVFLTSCETLPKNSEYWMEKEKNACLPTAIAFREGLRKYNVKSEVVVYYYFDKEKNKKGGHAIVAYMYPPGKNQLWTYDYMGSWKVRAFFDNPLQIAREAEKIRNNWHKNIYSASFLN